MSAPSSARRENEHATDSPGMQPYTVGLSSGFILVGGLLLVRVGLVGPPAPIVIHAIKVRVNQNFHLKSNEDTSFEMDCPVDTITICSLDSGSPPNNAVVPAAQLAQPAARSGSAPPGGGPLVRLEAGQEWSMKHLARIPNDNVLRPTTQPASQSSIRARHTILIELIYRVVKPGDADAAKDRSKLKQQLKDCKKLVVTKPLELYSCCARPASLTLPQYVEEAPKPDRDSASSCVCGMTFAVTIEHQGKVLLQEESDGLTFADIQKYEQRTRGRPPAEGAAAGPS